MLDSQNSPLAKADLSHRERIGIIAGGGSLPAAVAKAIYDAGCKPFIVGLEGNAEASIEAFPHCYVGVGQIGLMIRSLKQQNCKAIILIGSLRRPDLFRLKIDRGFILNLPRILQFMKGGDDTVLRKVARFFEHNGFEVHAVQDYATHLLAPDGSFSQSKASPDALADIQIGLNVIRALGAFDIGQAAIVSRGYVLAVEAAEGTDAMLERCKTLNRWGHKTKQGVLVKGPKPGQDLRLDLPAIGPKTVELAAAAGLAGIAVMSDQVLLADQDRLVETADQLGLFLHGVTSGL